MNKIILSAIGLLSAIAFTPQASALPAFARQTGMECSACHQQHFPVLNSFGRAFKAGGYTMMGAQTLVEGEHLSIPSNLNAAVLLKARYQRQNNTTPGLGDGVAGTNTGNGMIQLGDEFSIFFGGRVAENIGFLLENNLVAAGPLLSGLRLPIMHDVAGAKLSAIPFTTDALGVQYGYELSSAGVMRANRGFELRRDASAIQYAIADGNGSNGNWGGAASGLALVAQNDMGFVSYSRWSPNFGLGANGGAVPSFGLGSNYVRVAATPSVGDWALVTGVAFMSGSSELMGNGTAGVLNSAFIDTKAVSADLQAQGQVGGKDITVNVTYANAPAANAASARANMFNAGQFSKNAFAVAFDYSLIAHTLHLGGAYRTAKTGAADPSLATGTATSSATDNSVMVQAIYDLTQNVALHATTSRRSGTAYNADAVTGAKKAGQSEYLLMLEAAW